MLTTGGDGNNQVPPSNPYQVYCLLPLARVGFAILRIFPPTDDRQFCVRALCCGQLLPFTG